MRLLLGLLLASSAFAACSGSGLVWSCAAGSTSANIQTAIDSASDGATVTIAAGSYTFSGIDPTGSGATRNGMTVICAVSPLTAGATNAGGCTVSGGFSLTKPASTHTTNLVRISGFYFSDASGTIISIGYVSGDPQIDKLRIDHNTFNATTGVTIGFGASSPRSVAHRFGVMDHNLFQGSTHDYPIEVFGADLNDWGPSLQGTANNLFIEDNVFNYTSENLSASGMDAGGVGGAVVVRFNQITNARTSVHGVCHGGPANLEVYGNTYVGGTGSTGGYRIVHHQGSGEFIVFNNKLDPITATMELLHYRDSTDQGEAGTCTGNGISAYCDGNQLLDENRSPIGTYHGYACYHQPGRTGNGVLRPVYVWNNQYSANSTKVDLLISSAGNNLYGAYHMVDNRDYYNAASVNAQTSSSSPFNGSTGVGFGTLARRPTTCTANAEALDASNGGVAYWATDQGTWNQSPDSSYQGFGQSGVLYHCTSTNTWAAQYTPYAYPHPLVTGAVTVNPPPAGLTNAVFSNGARLQ